MVRDTTTAIALSSKLSWLGPHLHSMKPSPFSLQFSLLMVFRYFHCSHLIHADNGLERRKVLPKDVTEADFNKYILAANEAISAFDLEIRSTEHQISRKRTYALVNSTDDPITQLATSHTADEISYVKRVLDAMFETNNTPRKAIMAVSSTEAVRLAKAPSDSSRQTQNGSATQGSNGQSLTMVQAEKTLKNLVVEGWLELSDKGYYSLSPRALMELRGWLIDTYNDDDGDEDERDVRIRTCMACKEIITVVSVDLGCKAFSANVGLGPAMSQHGLCLSIA